MKKILKLGAIALSLFFMVACEPFEDSDYSLGKAPVVEDLNFKATPSGDKPNVITFENTSDVDGLAIWDLGNGANAKGDVVTASFPFKGDYVIVMNLYTKGGSNTISKTIKIAEDDMSLLNTPMYTALTGGASNLAGKTWVFDQFHNGHFGIGPSDKPTAEWWNAKAEEKTESSMYFNEFTFTQVGVKFVWKNNGSVYTNAPGKNALAALGYSNAVAPPAGDFDVKYNPASAYTFSLNENAKTLTLSNDAFLGHYAGTSVYQIQTLNDTVMYLRVVSGVEPGNAWYYRFVPKEKNIKPVIVIPVKAVPLTENFEGTPKVAFSKEDMGALTNFGYLNPAPVPINSSSKVTLYQKSGGFWSNLFFTASGYKFDLTTQNKVKLKVYIPSYNDYTTDNNKAGDWVSNAKLDKKVAVKLQNNGLGGDAYTTQTEVSFSNLQTDKWLDLTFDFSNVKDRKDYDKIVIQIGGEGHSGTGIFFIDDFSFGE
jgi:hypothetical protein